MSRPTIATDNRGFTLIDMLIALAVASFLPLIIMSTLRLTSGYLIKDDRRAELLEIAKGSSVVLLSKPPTHVLLTAGSHTRILKDRADTLDGAASDSGDFRVSWSVEKDAATGLSKIQVSVESLLSTNFPVNLTLFRSDL